MTAPITQRRRHLGGALAVALAALVLLPGAVAAHHADVTASLDCDGLLTFTATAWTGPNAASRTNSDIGVWVRKEGGSFVELTSDDYFFAASNGFSFTDTYDAGDADSVTVKVQAQANWANGSGPGDSRQVTVDAPDDCVQPTPVPPTDAPPTDAPPTDTPTDAPPTDAPPTDPPVKTPEPNGSVLSETGKPKTTLPPTATIDGSSDGGSGSALPIILIALLGIAVTIGLLSPASTRSRKRIRRE
jgi:hypothetical protein